MAGIAVASLHRDLLWAGGWVSNWGTITGGGDYWARFGEPSPVTHFWSLAIEEQFYLVWPLVILAVCTFGPHRRATVGLLSCAGAVGSIVVMNLMFDPVDPTGTYMNTFARAHSLLIGATAASVTIVLADGRLRGGASHGWSLLVRHSWSHDGGCHVAFVDLAVPLGVPAVCRGHGRRRRRRC